MVAKEKDLFAYIEELGNLYIFDVLLSYIYPRIFICKNDSGDKFILYEMSNQNNIDIWLTTKISEEEYNSICEKKVPIQDAYKNESNLFLISKVYGKSEDVTKIIYDDLKTWIGKLPKNPVYAEEFRFVESLKENKDG